MITCENLVKIYKVADLEVVALQGLDLHIEAGEMLGIVGASGSGKSTLLNILGGLVRPSAGVVRVGDLDLLKASDQQLDHYRRDQVGFIWQQTTRNLLPYLSVIDNVSAPLLIGGNGRGDDQAWVRELLEAVGLWEKRDMPVTKLSGGQQQRVAIALALANRPKILLGDEPTGELDSETAADVMALLHRINRDYATTVIIVTHDPDTAAALNRVVTIRDGRTSAETIRSAQDAADALAEQAQHAAQQFVVVDSVGRLQLPEEIIENELVGRRVTVETTDDGILLKRIDE